MPVSLHWPTVWVLCSKKHARIDRGLFEGAIRPFLNLLISFGNNNEGKVNFLSQSGIPGHKKAVPFEHCFPVSGESGCYLLPLAPVAFAAVLLSALLDASRNSFTWRAASLAGSIATSLSIKGCMLVLSSRL